jgi:hypothetical protein
VKTIQQGKNCIEITDIYMQRNKLGPHLTACLLHIFSKWIIALKETLRYFSQMNLEDITQEAMYWMAPPNTCRVD